MITEYFQLTQISVNNLVYSTAKRIHPENSKHLKQRVRFFRSFLFLNVKAILDSGAESLLNTRFGFGLKPIDSVVVDI